MKRETFSRIPELLAGRRWLVVLFVLACLLRVAYVLTLNAHALSWHDEVTYDQIAWTLARTGVFHSTPYEATPGLPAFLALVFVVFGHSYPIARVVHALVGGLLPVAVAGTADFLFNRRTALLAGFATALYPPLVYLAGVFYAEQIAAVLLASTIWAMARFEGFHRPGMPFVAGLLAGLLVLTRPVYFVMLPLAAVFLYVRSRNARARNTLLFLAAAVCTITPWTVRNAVVFHHFVPVSTGFGLQLWRGNNPLALGNADDRHLMPLNAMWQERESKLPAAEALQATARGEWLTARLQKLDLVEQDAFLRNVAVGWIARHPIRFVELSARRVITLYSPFSHTNAPNGVASARTRVIATLSFLPLLLLGIPGMWLAMRRRPGAWLIPATVCVMTLVYACLTAATRFRLPLDALLIMLAAVTIDALLSARAVNRDRDRSAPTARS